MPVSLMLMLQILADATSMRMRPLAGVNFTALLKVNEDLLEAERIGHQSGIWHDVVSTPSFSRAGLDNQEAGLQDGGMLTDSRSTDSF
jgi:hypothetical protein